MHFHLETIQNDPEVVYKRNQLLHEINRNVLVGKIVKQNKHET